MSEKIVVKSKLKDAKAICIMLPLSAILLYLILGFSASDRGVLGYDPEYGFGFGNGANYVLIPLIFVFAILGYNIYSRWSKVELVVTDKRVYGKDSFGKRVDLPLDAITAVATSSFSGLAVTTASGAIKFVMLKNRDEIHGEISKLLIGRQEKEKTIKETIVKQEVQQSNADELKKYKDLLDSGIITQEEFDAKKKQLLGL